MCDSLIFLCTGVHKEISCCAARTPRGEQGEKPSLLDFCILSIKILDFYIGV